MSNPMGYRAAILKSGLKPTTRHLLLTISCHLFESGEPAEVSIDALCNETGLQKKVVIDELKIASDAQWLSVSFIDFEKVILGPNQP